MRLLKWKNGARRITSLVLSAVLLVLSALPAFSQQTHSSLSIATLGSVSYVARANRGDYNEAFLLDAKSKGLAYEQLDSLLDSSFEAIKSRVESEGLKYVLVNGDLTYSGEYSNHEELSQRLLELEAQTGVNVIVLPGCNDINNPSASSFASGEREYVAPTTPSQFKTLYAELGYDIADSTYSGSTLYTAGLSYAVVLEGGYRLIVIDASYYQYLSGATTITGYFSDDLISWIKAQLSVAKLNGEIPIGVCYWDLYGESLFGDGNVISNADEAAAVLADNGMHYIFTAGSSKNDIKSIVTDNGNVLYDVTTADLISFPNTFRTSIFTSDEAYFEVVDADDVTPIVSRSGEVFEQPYRVTASLRLQYANFDLARYFTDMLTNYLDTVLIPGVERSSSLESFFSSQYGVSLTEEINELIGGGLNLLGVVVIFDASNIMNMLEDMYSQARQSFLKDSSALAAACYERLTALFNMQLTTVPCTQFISTYGFGDSSTGGTLSDLLLSVAAYSKYGNEDASEDAFIQTVLTDLRSGRLFPKIADAAAENLIGDFLFGDVLTQIELKPQYLLFLDDTEGSFGSYLQIAFRAYLALHGEGSSVTGAVRAILSDGFFDDYGRTIDEVLDTLVSQYYSGEDAAYTGGQLADIISELVTDTDPVKNGDFSISYSSAQGALVYATEDNYRLPVMVSITLGGDASTQAYVTWYTKSTVEGSDIEIYEGEQAQFIGKHYIAPDGVSTVKQNDSLERTYYRLDLGFASVGRVEQTFTRHTLKISGLTPGATYSLRVGDSDKGWWSDTINITTAQDSERVSFIHVSNSQGRTQRDFTLFANVLSGAGYRFPDADFILHTGNYVEDSQDFSQWNMLLETASDTLTNTPIVPVAGSGDTKETIMNNFAVGALLGDSGRSSVYYSFDYDFAHFVVLDSNDVKDDGTLSDEQLEWLESDMKDCTAKWRILAISNPVYTNSDAVKEDNWTNYRVAVADLAEEYGFDLVLTDNDGVYYRTDLMYNGEVTGSPTVSLPHQLSPSLNYPTIAGSTGVMYSAIGASGKQARLNHSTNNVSGIFSESGMSEDPDHPMFTGIEILGDTLYLTTYLVNNNTISRLDRVSIRKGAGRGIGDVNFDGEVTAADARIILRSTAKLQLLTADQYAVADVNSDGRITAADARAALRMAAGLDWTL